jgi:hypothetical protein
VERTVAALEWRAISVSSVTSADAVRRRIATLVLQEHETHSVGAFVLRPAQREAVRDIARAFIEYGGALLADPPGTGKTVIALAVAQREREVLVAAPATLRDQWLAAAARAGVAIRFASLESLSHGALPPRAPLLIVDEAHQARTPRTHRYARLAHLAMGAHVLLLTATPVVNGLRDRDALLALFLGARARGLDGADLARVIVRRAHLHAPRPVVQSLPALTHAADVDGIADALCALPPPLPVADGSAASALLRISLAMAWASSLAALDVALRRRIQRGAALADSLADGQWPGHSALRRWIIGDDATQLAIPLLLVDSGQALPPGAHAVLTAHLDAVRALRATVTPHVVTDTATRAAALRELAATHSTQRIVVFAQHASTITALYSALRLHGGVVAIAGDRVLAAHGRWTRREVLRAVGPTAGPFTMRDPRGIRILLTTDLLAEGVELQGMGIVVHGDPAWTPTRLTQRVGRAARIGGGSEVLVTRFPLPRGAASILQLAPRLTRKAAAGAEALSDARVEERIRQRLGRWLVPAASPTVGAHNPHGVSVASSGTVASGDKMAQVAHVAHVAHAASPRDGFIAVLRTPTGALMVVGQRSARGWRVSSEPRRVLRSLNRASGPALPGDSKAEHAVRRALARWLRQRRALVSSGLAPALEPRLQRAVQRRVGAAVDAAPLAMRTEVARSASTALRAVLSAPGDGVTRALERLCRSAFNPTAFLGELTSLAESLGPTRDKSAGPAADDSGSAAPAPDEPAPPALPAPAPRLAALLILREANHRGGSTPTRAT